MKREAGRNDGLSFDAAHFPDASDAGLQKRRRLMSAGFCGASARMVMGGFRAGMCLFVSVSPSLHSQKATRRIKGGI